MVVRVVPHDEAHQSEDYENDEDEEESHALSARLGRRTQLPSAQHCERVDLHLNCYRPGRHLSTAVLCVIVFGYLAAARWAEPSR